MTVCVCVLVHDCLVFAADSASTLVNTNAATGESQVLNVYQHGDKVFNLYKGLPICAMTCGMGNVGQWSIGTLAKELRRRMANGEDVWRLDKSNYTLEQVALKARKLIFEEKYASLVPQPPAPHSLEFWIGGYSSNFDDGHEVWKISIVNGACPEPERIATGGATGWFASGQPGPINRLIVGFDQRLFDELVAAGMKDTEAQALVNHLRSKLEAALVWPTMPVIDAIDLAEFLVETTKRFYRFLPGADIVGGDSDIAVVTKYEGFKWIKRKHFYSPVLNPLETDHA
jgi:hypothetical protein